MRGYICFFSLAFVLSFGVTMLSCMVTMFAFMVGNESEAIKNSDIRGETKLFLGENGSFLERNPHFFVDSLSNPLFIVATCMPKDNRKDDKLDIQRLIICAP